MKLRKYYHRCDEESSPKDIIEPVINRIERIEFTFERGCSKKLREKIKRELQLCGWSDKIRLVSDSQISVTAIRGEIALCLQTGNMSRFYADLLKLEFLYKENKAESAVYIIPTKARAKEMGSNLACYERFVEEIELFNKIITVPMFVIGLD